MVVTSNSIDRIVTFKNSQLQSGRGTILHLSRAQIVFEVYNPYSIVQLGEVLQELTILRGGAIVYKGKVVVVNLVNTGLMLIVSATFVDGWQDLKLLLDSKADLKREISQFVGEWETTKRIRPSYQVAVGDLRSFLSQLSPWLDQVDMASGDRPQDVPDDAFVQLRDELLPKVRGIQQQFEEEAKQVSSEELESHRLFAQRDLLPLMMRAPFFHRSYTKPLGYAGDYMMVKMMVDGVREGPTTYARLVNDFYLEIDLVKAHRNRLKILERQLTDLAQAAEIDGRTVSILNVGCGPAIEIVRFIRNCPYASRCAFELLDFNAETIEHARESIEAAKRETGRQVEVKFVRQSVNNLIKTSSTRDKPTVRRFDFVYCAGLFDYLSDRICQRLLKLFCNWTHAGGSVLATNVHPDNPTRFIMEHVIEWALIHRNMADMVAIAPENMPHRVFDDPTHMNVFLSIAVTEN